MVVYFNLKWKITLPLTFNPSVPFISRSSEHLWWSNSSRASRAPGASWILQTERSHDITQHSCIRLGQHPHRRPVERHRQHPNIPSRIRHGQQPHPEPSVRHGQHPHPPPAVHQPRWDQQRPTQPSSIQPTGPQNSLPHVPAVPQPARHRLSAWSQSCFLPALLPPAVHLPFLHYSKSRFTSDTHTPDAD